MVEIMLGTSPLLLEIGTEDLPARFLAPALQQLEEHAARILRGLSIRFSAIETYGTPRRLALIADGLPRVQEDRVREIVGPSSRAAFDANGNPTKAAVGFAQSVGVTVDRLVIKRKGKGEYVVAVVEEKGRPVHAVLPEALEKIVLSLHFPKTMRWGNGDLRFARPIRWLLALFGTENIDFEVDGIRSGDATMGHRFLSPVRVRFHDAASYKSVLAEHFVIVDQSERKETIARKMDEILLAFQEKPVHDEELLDTVVNLVEYPVPVLATFPREYLTLPRELLITVMKGHQKYFAVEDRDGAITNHFIVVSNTGEENADTVRIGAERVIRARFEDARFYFEEDRKVPLDRRIDALRSVTFQERLGSLYDKTERVAAFAEFLADRLMPAAKERLVRAAWLSKTDLLSGVVREFPELQGTMGKYYAALGGESADVAQAIEEQYLPSTSGGALPQTDIGALLSLADKVDTIAAFFSVGIVPTGSEDPYALRRHALGVVAILLGKSLEVSLHDIIEKALSAFPDGARGESVRAQVSEFFLNRVEAVLSDLGFSEGFTQSVLGLSLRVPLCDVRERMQALARFSEHPLYPAFLAAVKRVHNILPKVPVPPVNADVLIDDEERVLKANLDGVRGKLRPLLDERRYDDALVLFSSLADAINAFFDRVLVMDKREEIRLNRLSLLREVWETVASIADFSKLSAP